jgi:hypothetical protein
MFNANQAQPGPHYIPGLGPTEVSIGDLLASSKSKNQKKKKGKGASQSQGKYREHPNTGLIWYSNGLF